MFKSLQDFFNSKTTLQDKSAGTKIKASGALDLQLAAATLMFEVVRSDGEICESELITMGDFLKKQFGISDEDVETMIELAQASSEDAISLQGFTREICENWGNAERAKLLEHLWAIALADNTIDAHERHTVRKVAGLLYLNDGQIARAKENAKAMIGNKDF
jgi:uncharacterized tellurite resistance protein B-like protein